MLNDWVKVAKVSNLRDPDMMVVNAGKNEILLAKVNGVYYAINNVCSHAYAMLDQGTLHADALEVECPLHESYFHLETGAARHPPAEEPVATYGVKVEGDDILVGPKA
ncbi:MAG: non-heme iron oxygenase ferredoxin subunit [SAR202 cluster bacterium]|nr:non-heme iron oxygenase ferredoxin subunit [SAR202 cluster bacterium]